MAISEAKAAKLVDMGWSAVKLLESSSPDSKIPVLG